MNSSSATFDIFLIDFEPFLHGSLRDRDHVAASIDAGLRSTGFIYLKNHGIDLHKVEECFSWSRRFFALQESEKELIRNRPQYRGYSGIGNEKVHECICMKEGFVSGNPKDDGQVNVWPSEELLPGFRRFMEDFWKDCTRLLHHLLECLTIALKLPPNNSLSRYHTQSLFNLNLLHYPAVSKQLLHSNTLARIPAHSDFGTLTLLFQDNTGGLEIADMTSTNTEKSAEFEKLGGKFRSVKPIEGTIVVNVGYLLMRWSNGRWKNTIHRVVDAKLVDEREHEGRNREDDDLCLERYSIPFFAVPDPETVIEALPGCWSEDMPKRWGPINAGRYVKRKREGAYR